MYYKVQCFRYLTLLQKSVLFLSLSLFIFRCLSIFFYIVDFTKTFLIARLYICISYINCTLVNCISFLYFVILHTFQEFIKQLLLP